jgi:hypothetical protein
MIHQNWLVKRDVPLLCVHHRPPDAIPLGAAVLFAGFSHPMCDVDYFMSKLARRLAKSGLFVAQVDPRGHGDSPGDSSSVDLDTLREDIAIVIDHYTARFPESLLCIGRGLAAPLLAEASATRSVLGVAGVSPYCIHPQAIRSYLEEVNTASNDAFAIFPGNDYVALTDFSDAAICLMSALGVVPYNIHGMGISARLLSGLADFDPLAALQRAGADKSLWLLRGGEDEGALTSVRFDASSAYPPMATYRGDTLPRDPTFHRTVISRLTEWALDRCAMS